MFQSFVYYDVYGCTLHLIFVGVGCFTMYAGHMLPMRYCDVLHRSALHLGAWSRVEPRSHVPVAFNWVGETLWPFGSLVRHSRELYRAQGTYNAAEPGNTTHARFHVSMHYITVCLLTASSNIYTDSVLNSRNKYGL